jgi:hypothetical protein
MDYEVICLFGDLTGNTYAWQIYDNDHDGTIDAGAMRGFQYTSEMRGGHPAPGKMSGSVVVVWSSRLVVTLLAGKRCFVDRNISLNLVSDTDWFDRRCWPCVIVE